MWIKKTGENKMELYTQILLFVGYGGFITFGIQFFTQLKGGKKLEKIIMEQQNLLEKVADSFKEVVKEHCGLNEDARRTMRSL